MPNPRWSGKPERGGGIRRKLRACSALPLLAGLLGFLAALPPALGASGARVSFEQRLAQDPSAEECTIAVVSGAAGADGRPLLWKNRDTGEPPNEVVYFNDGKLRYLALVTAGESRSAWLGVNEAGFAICNALSYNLPDSSETGITNGALMKLALQTCATVEAFDSLLVVTGATGRQNPANLGVIDAQGGAALFEVGSRSFRRFDAADRAAAPEGVLIRANFSLSADTSGMDTWRFRRATELVRGAALEGGVEVARLLRTARDLRNVAVDPYPLPYMGAPPQAPEAVGRVNTEETINRRYTVSAGIVAGVRPGEDSRLTTFFAVDGHPVVTPAVPLWVAAGNAPPEVDGAVTAPICDVAIAREAVCFDVPRYRGLLNTRPLVEGEAFLTQVEAIERWLLPETQDLLERWKAASPEPLEMRMAELSLARRVLEEYMPTRAPSVSAITLWPNPTRGSALIRYPLLGVPERGLEVFDPLGRPLRVLKPDAAEGGRSDALGLVLWDGADSRGRPVASGTYFFRPQGTDIKARVVVIH